MALVKKYHSTVKTITEPIPGILSVEFTSEKKFKFRPGQFLHLALDEYNPTTQWPDSRCFSMQSSPKEKTVKITFSVVGNYTKRMKEELIIGKKIWLKLPYGNIFTGSFKKNNSVFIAGGTGITPFLSLFTDQTFNEYQNAKLYFGIREKNHQIYEKELEATKLINPSFRLLIKNQQSDGMLNIQEIFSENGISSTYFISGPPIMINNFKSFLIEKGVDEENILTDDWE